MNWSLLSARGHAQDVDGCLVMGILNATPDSFSDGGRPIDERRIQDMIAAGADILDVGGESTRPGHQPVASEEERRRVVPVVEAIRRLDQDIWISIDTQKADVAAAALDAGADFINDVSGLGEAAMARVVRDAGCSVVLMRRDAIHGDIVRGCKDQLRSLLARARAGGISDMQVILDPGLGFGARPGADVQDNIGLIDGLDVVGLGYPMLIGHSRKRFVGAWSGSDDVSQRDAPSAALSVRARDAGAAIVRVHDVGATRRALAG